MCHLIVYLSLLPNLSYFSFILFSASSFLNFFLLTLDTEASSSQNSSTGNKEKESETAGKNLENESKPLLTKKIVLGILSELVKSYSSVAQLIAEYEIQRPGKQSNPQVGGGGGERCRLAEAYTHNKLTNTRFILI